MPIAVKRGASGQFESMREKTDDLDPGAIVADAESDPPTGPAPEIDEERSIQRPVEILADPAAFSVEAKVVYLGAHPHKTVVLPGSVLVTEDAEGKTLYVPTNSGDTHEVYDFSKTDNRGKLIRARLTPDGRVFSLCRHIGHLVTFVHLRGADGSPEFEVRARREVREKVERYMAEQRSAKARNRDTGEALLREMGLA